LSHPVIPKFFTIEPWLVPFSSQASTSINEVTNIEINLGAPCIWGPCAVAQLARAQGRAWVELPRFYTSGSFANAKEVRFSFSKKKKKTSAVPPSVHGPYRFV
jgi:hypothetical protein